MRIIRITSNRDGMNHIECFGFTGEDCVKTTLEVERRLGLQVGERQLKPEFHETESDQEKEDERDH